MYTGHDRCIALLRAVHRATQQYIQRYVHEPLPFANSVSGKFTQLISSTSKQWELAPLFVECDCTFLPMNGVQPIKIHPTPEDISVLNIPHRVQSEFVGSKSLDWITARKFRKSSITHAWCLFASFCFNLKARIGGVVVRIHTSEFAMPRVHQMWYISSHTTWIA